MLEFSSPLTCEFARFGGEDVGIPVGQKPLVQSTMRIAVKGHILLDGRYVAIQRVRL